MEINIRNIEDAALLLELVETQLNAVASGEAVHGGEREQAAMIERLNNLAVAIRAAQERGHAEDIGWTMID